LADKPGDLVARGSDDLDRHPGGIRKVPVQVALARQDRARVSTAHRHDEVGPFDVLTVELVRNPALEIDPDLPHGFDDPLMHYSLGPGSRGSGLTTCALVERLRHLRAA